MCRNKGIGNPYATKQYVWFDGGAMEISLYEIPYGENDYNVASDVKKSERGGEQ